MFKKLMQKNGSVWAKLWEPIIKSFPERKLEKIPELLRPVERINIDRLRDRLDAIRIDEPGNDTTKQVIIWSVTLGVVALVLLMFSAGCVLRRYRLLPAGKARLVARAESEIRKPKGVLFPDRSDETATEQVTIPLGEEECAVVEPSIQKEKPNAVPKGKMTRKDKN